MGRASSRSIAVIWKMLKDPKMHIFVCYSYTIYFIKESLYSNRVCYRTIKTDVGYFLENNSVNSDNLRLFEEYKNFINDWDFKVEQEQEIMKINHIDLVISDISPLPFESAQEQVFLLWVFLTLLGILPIMIYVMTVNLHNI